MEPTNGEPCVLALNVVVGSLLAKLPVECLLIRAGHPLPVVLMQRLAANLTGTFLGVSLRLVEAFAVAQAGHGINSKCKADGEWDGDPADRPCDGGIDDDSHRAKRLSNL